MSTMCKTPNGTIGAFRFGNSISAGIAAGIYGKGNCISLEYNFETGQFELLIADELLEEQGITVKHVGRKSFSEE